MSLSSVSKYLLLSQWYIWKIIYLKKNDKYRMYEDLSGKGHKWVPTGLVFTSLIYHLIGLGD